MNLTREEKVEQLERVLQSRTLHGSESLKAFLRFVVLKALDNQEGTLKEYTIATEVFGRSSNYDSRSDSVVRVQAGRLRSKLQEYYATEGSDDRILIELPKGHYTPTFSYAQKANGSAARKTSLFQADSSLTGPEARRDKRLMLITAGFVLLSIVLGMIVFSYRSETQRLKSSLNVKGAESTDSQSIAPLWDDFLRSPEPTLVTFSNTLFEGTAETGMKLLKPFDSPGISGGSPALTEGEVNVNNAVVTQHYTGIGEVMGVYCLGDFFYKAGHSIRVKRSLLLTWDDLKTENIVVLGSPAENLLLRDLPQEQDFVFQLVTDDKQNKTFGILNTKPRPGEQTVYWAKQEGSSRSQISEDYALISLLRGLDQKNRLMVLAGITTFGTQAAAEYVTKPEYIKELISRLNTSPAGEPPRLPSYYQVLVKVKVNGGVPVQLSYVTHHVL